MYLCLYMYMYMYMYMYTHASTCMYRHLHTYMYMYMFVHVHVMFISDMYILYMCIQRYMYIQYPQWLLHIWYMKYVFYF